MPRGDRDPHAFIAQRREKARAFSERLPRKPLTPLLAASLVTLLIISGVAAAFTQGVPARIAAEAPHVNLQVASAATTFSEYLAAKTRAVFCWWLACGTLADEGAEQRSPTSLETTNAYLQTSTSSPLSYPDTFPQEIAPEERNPKPVEPGPSPQPIQQTVVNQPVIERVVETVRTVSGGLSESVLDARLAALNQDLTTRMNSLAAAGSAQTTTVYNTVSQALNIEELTDLILHSPVIDGGSITGASIGSLTSALPIGSGGTGLTSAPSYGELLLGNASGGYTLTATSSLGIAASAITAIGPTGQTQTGATITLASSTSAFNGLTSALTIVGSGDVLTFAPSISGTLDNTGLTNSSLTVSAGSGLGGGGAVSLGGSTTLSLDTANANSWSALQQFQNASSSLASVYHGLFIGDTATTTILGSATSTFGAGLEASALNITSSSATSTFANGLNISAGCFAIGGTCVGGGGGGATGASGLGMVAAFATSTCPVGWVETNGSAISRTTYADLFAQIGTSYGSGDGSTTFNVPDYRGRFLRGWDNGAGIDPDAASRTDRGDGTTGDNVGTVQQDEFESHTHGINDGSNPVQGNGGQPRAATGDVRQSTATGGNETRPKNINVLYCMSYEDSIGGSGADIAEFYETDGLINAGDIVAPGLETITYFDRGLGSTTTLPILEKARDTRAPLGVVSTKPAISIGAEIIPHASNAQPIALSGRVPVKVNLEGGPIVAGDRITVSSVPGVGKRAGPFDGTIGMALHGYDGEEEGRVLIFVDPQRGFDLAAFDTSFDTREDTASSSASTTASARTTSPGFFALLFTRLTHWFANAANGITKFFAREGHFTEKVCIGSTCVTEAELQSLLNQKNPSSVQSSSPSSTPPSSPPVEDNTEIEAAFDAAAPATPETPSGTPPAATSSEPVTGPEIENDTVTPQTTSPPEVLTSEPANDNLIETEGVREEVATSTQEVAYSGSAADPNSASPADTDAATTNASTTANSDPASD